MTASALQHPALRVTFTSIAILFCLFRPAQAETLTGNARVIDGDTLAVAGERVRLDAIDAPESRQSCTRNGRPWACGKAATQAMRKLVGRNPVRCEVNRRDRYGRAIGACFANGRGLQQQLVRMGLALAYRHYSTRYVPDEDAARKEGIGLWSGSFVEPWRWREERKQRIRPAPRRQAPRSPSSAGRSCLIKGNISSNGRIYHVPGGRYYDRTGIDESRGERWFCSEAEARAAGWRRSRK
ncbi:MAG: thermonuclease family protein [Alphaproteobacteria bacterium]|nr:thermonuclease family protein [Alphaproteobacteria bacterium]